LGWKEGTVSSRLAKARAILQARLERRGVALSAVLSGLALAQQASAAVPAALLTATQKAALAFVGALAGGASAPASLARAVLWGMALARLKVAAVLLTLVGLVGGAALALSRPAPPEPAPEPDSEPDAVQPRPARGGPDAPPRNRMTVGGFVIGPD